MPGHAGLLLPHRKWDAACDTPHHRRGNIYQAKSQRAGLQTTSATTTPDATATEPIQ